MNKTYNFSNKELLVILKEVLAAMEVKEVNKFRIRAYQNVISSVEGLTQSVQDLWERNKVSEISGVGATLKQHLNELFTTGTVKDFEAIKQDLPMGMFSLIGLRGVGAKKAYKLANALDLKDRDSALDDLKIAAESNKIRVIEGFAEKSEKDILEAITESKMHKKEKERMLYSTAHAISSRISEYLYQFPSVDKVEVLGSYRRKASTVGDLDIAVATSDPEGVVNYFVQFPEIGDVMSTGDKGARVVLKNDVQIDFRVIKKEAFGAMVQYFTGSKIHNVALRTHALNSGKSLSEYGIKEDNTLKEFADEKGFYNYIGLEYIPPEIRQGKNEIELASKNKLPKLIDLTDIRGDIHTHTTASDGVNELEEMVEKAINLGYDYIGISDHAPSVTIRGEEEVMNIIDTQRERIEHLSSSKGIKVLMGYEVNILKNATLAMPDSLLKKLDYVIASIHTSFDEPKDVITTRLINAIENPYVSIIGHPTNRLINERASCEVHWDKVFDAAIEHNKLFEINSQPNRMDLPDDLVYEARERGLKFIINTDAHEISQMDNMFYGVNVAKRGWCTKEDIVNTLPLDKFLRILKVER